MKQCWAPCRPHLTSCSLRFSSYTVETLKVVVGLESIQGSSSGSQGNVLLEVSIPPEKEESVRLAHVYTA